MKALLYSRKSGVSPNVISRICGRRPVPGSVMNATRSRFAILWTILPKSRKDSTEVKGSGAYVAIERVTGTLKGHEGSFALQHMGTMTQSVPTLTINIVPDSGTGQLKGIAGKMTITITAEGKHTYDVEYTLP